MKIPEWIRGKIVSKKDAVSILNNSIIMMVSTYGRLPLPMIKLAIHRKRLFNPDFNRAYCILQKAAGETGLHNLICAVLVRTTMYSHIGTDGGKKKIIPVTGNVQLLKLLNTKAP